MNVQILSGLAMLAFAANSILCRMALQAQEIDAASFTLIRLFAGSIALVIFVLARHGRMNLSFHWPSALMLFIYMAAFSFGYLELSAGIGALILFGAVQLTMLGYAASRGEYFSLLAWGGILTAMIGLILLLAPGDGRPGITGSLLMTVAGVAWGIYSLLGKRAQDPMAATAANFLIAVPLALLLWLPGVWMEATHFSTRGIILAILSGVLASAAGYAVWYAALKQLSASSASVLQLSVPVIAGIGGFLLLSEIPDLRFVSASVLVLIGIWVVLQQRNQLSKDNSQTAQPTTLKKL